MRRLMLMVLMLCGIAVSYGQVNHTLTVMSGPNGTTNISYTGTADTIEETGDTRYYSVQDNSDVTLTFNPLDGFQIGKVLIDGADVTSTLSMGAISEDSRELTVISIVSDVLVEVTYESKVTNHHVLIMTFNTDDSPEVYGRTFCAQSGDSEGKGPNDGAFDFQIGAGLDLDIKFAPEEGCRLAHVYLTRSEDPAYTNTDVVESVVDNFYTVSNVSGEVDVRVYYEKIPARTLKITSGGAGSISFTTATSIGVVEANQNNTFTINDGDSLTLTFTPRSDAYKLVTATVNGWTTVSR